MKAGTTRLKKAECPACGYIVRVSSRWLDASGAPLCPCNGEPMLDCREGIEDEARIPERTPNPIRDRYVLTDQDRTCWDCGVFHDVGALMHQSCANLDGRITWRYYCATGSGTCEPEHYPDYSGDVPPWSPPGNRVAA